MKLISASDGDVYWFAEPTSVHMRSNVCTSKSLIQTHACAIGFGGTILTLGTTQAPSLR